MPRIFACMAIAQLIVFFGTAALGLVRGAAGNDRHIVLAVFSLILSCLIQVIALTYLTVTGKMIAQAVHLGGFDPAAIMEAKRLKRSWTWLLAIVVVTIVLVTATGANVWRTGQGSMLHLLAACAVVAVHVFVFYREYGIITQNAALLERVLRVYVQRRRVAPSG